MLGRLALLLPVLAHAVGQGADVAGVVVVVVDQAQLRKAARALQPQGGGIEHAGRGRRAVLRVQRQQQHALAALGVQGLQLALDGGLAVAHGGQHGNVQPRLLQALAQQLGLALCPDGQGRSGLTPHAGVFGGGLAWAHPQNDAVQDRQPKQRRNLYHAPVGQKLRQIAPQCLGRGRIGGAQIAQHDGHRARCGLGRRVAGGWGLMGDGGSVHRG